MFGNSNKPQQANDKEISYQNQNPHQPQPTTDNSTTSNNQSNHVPQRPCTVSFNPRYHSLNSKTRNKPNRIETLHSIIDPTANVAVQQGPSILLIPNNNIHAANNTNAVPDHILQTFWQPQDNSKKATGASVQMDGGSNQLKTVT